MCRAASTRSSGWNTITHKPPPTGKPLFLVNSIRNSSFMSASFAGILSARSLACDQSSVEVVEFPGVLVGRPFEDPLRQAGNPGRAGAERGGHPAVVVNAAAAHDFEILGVFHFLGLGIGEGGGKADAVERVLGDAVDHAAAG